MNQSQQMQQLITEIQSKGVRLASSEQEHVSRRGGAGPSDHQAMVIDGTPVMVPVHTQSANYSPFTLSQEKDGSTKLIGEGIPITDVTFAKDPKFYSLKTSDGTPYSHIATLHSTDVLATTVLQNCIRYGGINKTCKFCSIEQSLAAGRTIAYKRPAQLAEVAKAAVELDGVKHMVMTTGTPSTPDRGAKVLCDSVRAVKQAVDLPVQVQCEPPTDHSWFKKLKDAGADALGMHIEVVTPSLRKFMMPSKSQITIDEYMDAFRAAVPIFGWGQVSTYILAGLGDSTEDILSLCDELIDIGVYPFVVPFVPIRGTPLEDHKAPSAEFMRSIIEPLGAKTSAANMLAENVKAGCAKCGACSSLKKYEESHSQVLN
ncbi:MSMEG_0568 family radical SAM protein [Agaribacter marinus]|uniref:Radical SAM protein n=1 Tax=Agaribacter marinus TaxID=1431249 RepID=A0AA37WKT1_9ALTE|nr:MSMEG_0568 family radical SAM protein [Agaribacter marinus]GLR71225.1 radical SAM protein [Agaribacter marinus]